MTRNFSWIRRVAVQLIAAVAPAAVALAQRQPIVLQHGLGANGASWSYAAIRLKQDFPVDTLTPSTGGYDLFEVQASRLVQALTGLPDTLVGLGHSNGANVLRWANKNGRNMKALISLGSPLTGDWLALHIPNYDLAFYGEWIAGYMVAPIVTYGAYFGGFGQPSDWWYSTAYWLGWTGANALFVLTSGVAAYYGFNNANPLMAEMIPGSPFMTAVNAQSNLLREQTAIPTRVSITSQVSSYDGLMFHAVLGNGTSADIVTAYWYVTAGVYLSNWEHYINTPYDSNDPDWQGKVNNAYQWLNAAGAMVSLDPVYCAYFVNGGTVCRPNDGVVPVTSQTWGIATRVWPITGPTHTDEKPSSNVYQNGIYATLTNDVHVPVCSSLPASSVTVTSTLSTYGVGATPQMSTQVKNLCNIAMPGAPVTWSSGNTSVATVSSTGLVTALTPGIVGITATSGAASGSKTLTIVAGIASVTISGPTAVNTSTGGQWTATPNGGVAPYSYQWKVNGVLKQSGGNAAFNYTPTATGTMTLSVTVVDVNQATKTKQISVSVVSCGPPQQC